MEFLNKETRKIIERSLPKKARRAYKNGEEITITIFRLENLKRWGDEAQLTITKNGKIIENDLIEAAWNYDQAKAAKEAANAVDYYVYGQKGKIEIRVNPYTNEHKNVCIGGDWAIMVA